ncbi:MAG: helix-turn-helix domain-containing protein [Chlamydiales bacterium]
MLDSEDNISCRIREIRLEMGLTQEQFAVKLGVSFPTVNRWENQKAKPSPLAIEKLRKLFLNCKRKTLIKQNKEEAAGVI